MELLHCRSSANGLCICYREHSSVCPCCLFYGGLLSTEVISCWDGSLLFTWINQMWLKVSKTTSWNIDDAFLCVSFFICTRVLLVTGEKKRCLCCWCLQNWTTCTVENEMNELNCRKKRFHGYSCKFYFKHSTGRVTRCTYCTLCR